MKLYLSKTCAALLVVRVTTSFVCCEVVQTKILYSVNILSRNTSLDDLAVSLMCCSYVVLSHASCNHMEKCGDAGTATHIKSMSRFGQLSLGERKQSSQTVTLAHIDKA